MVISRPIRAGRPETAMALSYRDSGGSGKNLDYPTIRMRGRGGATPMCPIWPQWRPPQISRPAPPTGRGGNVNGRETPNYVAFAQLRLLARFQPCKSGNCGEGGRNGGDLTGGNLVSRNPRLRPRKSYSNLLSAEIARSVFLGRSLAGEVPAPILISSAMGDVKTSPLCRFPEFCRNSTRIRSISLERRLSTIPMRLSIINELRSCCKRANQSAILIRGESAVGFDVLQIYPLRP